MCGFGELRCYLWYIVSIVDGSMITRRFFSVTHSVGSNGIHHLSALEVQLICVLWHLANMVSRHARCKLFVCISFVNSHGTPYLPIAHWLSLPESKFSQLLHPSSNVHLICFHFVFHISYHFMFTSSVNTTRLCIEEKSYVDRHYVCDPIATKYWGIYLFNMEPRVVCSTLSISSLKTSRLGSCN